MSASCDPVCKTCDGFGLIEVTDHEPECSDGQGCRCGGFQILERCPTCTAAAREEGKQQ